MVEAANVCLWGVSRFLGSQRLHPKKRRSRQQTPQVRRRGRLEAVSYEAALEEAAALLRGARRPVIYGLTNSGSLAQEAALGLARGLSARLEPADLGLMGQYYQALKQHPRFWAPLEVIRDEADTVLFWGANPLRSCPRLLVRYAVFARGRFTERGVEDRRVAAVDLYRTETAKFCQPFVQLAPGQDLALIQGLTDILINDRKPDPPVTGARKLADFLAQAGYGAVFFGRGAGYGPAAGLLPQLVELVARLNEQAPFVLFPLSGDFNSSGLYHLLLRELGEAGAPDFGDDAAAGVCHYTPLNFREADALLVTGADLFWLLPEETRQDLIRRQAPIIVLTPFANHTSRQARVVIPVALDGVEAEEVAYRLDGLPLVLRKLTPSPYLPAHRVLADLGGYF